jgi:hypothetical protein
VNAYGLRDSYPPETAERRIGLQPGEIIALSRDREPTQIFERGEIGCRETNLPELFLVVRAASLNARKLFAQSAKLKFLNVIL